MKKILLVVCLLSSYVFSRNIVATSNAICYPTKDEVDGMFAIRNNTAQLLFYTIKKVLL